jgi:hypothetical protein
VIDGHVLGAFPSGQSPSLYAVEKPVGSENSGQRWRRRRMPGDGVDAGAVELAGEGLEEGHEL